MCPGFKTCVDFVLEYFIRYLDISDEEMKSGLQVGHKPFIKGHKQDLKLLMMYEWAHNITDVESGFWEEYLNRVMPYIK